MEEMGAKKRRKVKEEQAANKTAAAVLEGVRSSRPDKREWTR